MAQPRLPKSQPQNVYPPFRGEFAGAVFCYLPSVSLTKAKNHIGSIGGGTPVLAQLFGARVAKNVNSYVNFTGTRSMDFTNGMTILVIGSHTGSSGTQVMSLINRQDSSAVGGFDVATYNKWATPNADRLYASFYKPAVGDTNFDSAWVDGVKDTTGNGSFVTVDNRRYVIGLTTATGPAAHATVDLNVAQSSGIDVNSATEFVVIWPRKFSEQQLQRITNDPYSVFVPQRRPRAATSTAAAYSLTAGLGTYALTGVAAGLRADRKLTAGLGTYALTGQAVGVRASRRVTAVAGTFALTGQAAGLRAARKLTAGAGAYALTGQAAGLSYGRTLAAGLGTFALSGQAANLLYGRRLAAGAGSYALNGQASALLSARIMPAGTGAYTLSGIAAGLLYGRTLAAGTGSFVLSGQNAAFPISRHLIAGAGTYVLSGQAIQFSGQAVLTAQAGTYELNGQAVGLLYSRIMPAGAGAFALSGIDAGLLATRVLSADSGGFSLSGQAATFSIGTSGGSGASAAEIWNYVLSNGKTAGQNVVEIRSLLDTLTPGFWDFVIEGTFTAADLLRVIAAVQAGKSTITPLGAGQATVEFRAVDDSEVRVTAEMDGSERTEVTLNAN